MLPWFGGLALLSYLGDYGGGRGTIGFGSAIPILFVFSVVIYVLALSVRLDRRTVDDHIEHVQHEAEIEESELGGGL